MCIVYFFSSVFLQIGNIYLFEFYNLFTKNQYFFNLTICIFVFEAVKYCFFFKCTVCFSFLFKLILILPHS